MEPFLIGAFCVIAIFLAVIARRRANERFERKIREIERQARLQGEAREEREREVEERERQANEQRVRVRKEARERARIAYPELLDEQEAEGFDVENPELHREISDADCELIDKAEELVRQELHAIEAANPGEMSYWPEKAQKEWLAVDEQMDTLKAPDEDPPHYEEVSNYLGPPERVIDCGQAGQIRLYTAEQAKRAQEDSGAADYLVFLKRRAAAPTQARQIIERAALIEQKKREAEEAYITSITTKLDDLPPLPAKEN